MVLPVPVYMSAARPVNMQVVGPMQRHPDRSCWCQCPFQVGRLVPRLLRQFSRCVSEEMEVRSRDSGMDVLPLDDAG